MKLFTVDNFVEGLPYFGGIFLGLSILTLFYYLARGPTKISIFGAILAIYILTNVIGYVVNKK